MEYLVTIKGGINKKINPKVGHHYGYSFKTLKGAINSFSSWVKNPKVCRAALIMNSKDEGPYQIASFFNAEAQ